jgi:hypothetical protein
MCGFKHVNSEFVLMCYTHGYGKLAIAQHQNTLCYAIIYGGGYRPQVQRFEPRYYVYLQ